MARIGYGDGYGSGDGSGYGYSSGYGDGYGSGSGSGYGYGDDSGETLAAHLSAAYPPPKGWEGSTIAIWRSDKAGKPSNGGRGIVAAVGAVHEVPGPLQACTPHALHASHSPGQWRGERWWVVALAPPVVEQGDKLASLKRLVLAEL